jgi:pimeloyl-ACP methyl ester carboxylesterase
MSTLIGTAPAWAAPPAGRRVVEALVQTGHTETLYRRAGRGAPVVLLGGPLGPMRADLALFYCLARRFRVVAPEVGWLPSTEAGAEPDPARPSFCGWLRGVIDGLGLVRPAIVVEDSLGIATLRFALTDPERVDRLVVVCYDGANAATAGDSLDDKQYAAGHPLLLQRVDGTTRASAFLADLPPGMIEFLEAGGVG